jgi:hypothetical protein
MVFCSSKRPMSLTRRGDRRSAVTSALSSASDREPGSRTLTRIGA